MRLLLTRPEPDAGRCKAQLEALNLGLEILVEPLLQIEFAGCEVIDLHGVQALIATSRNGLRALREPQISAHMRQVAQRLPVITVGKATTALARDMGFATIHQGSGRAASLPAVIAKTAQPADGALLHLAGDKLAFDLAAPLVYAGFAYQKSIVYRAKPTKQLSQSLITLFRKGKIDTVLLMSPRTAKIYANLVNEHQLSDFINKTIHFCLSEAIAKQLKILPGVVIATPVAPDSELMLALIADTVAKKR